MLLWYVVYKNKPLEEMLSGAQPALRERKALAS
jgi:hypothetical protein